MRNEPARRVHNVLPGTQTASFWVDESGSVQTAGDCFVIAAVKTRHPDELQRALRAVREGNRQHLDELKFGRIKSGNVKVYRDVVDVLMDSDARLSVLAVDGAIFNPFRGDEASWVTHAKLIGQLVAGTMNQNEVATVAMDVVSTPAGSSMGPVVKRHVNGMLRTTAVTTAVTLNSKTNDLLQAADIVAGSVFHQRATKPDAGAPEKAEIARRLAMSFGVASFEDDVRVERLTVKTFRPRERRNERTPRR